VTGRALSRVWNGTLGIEGVGSLKLSQLDRLSVLACVTGLSLLAIFFAATGLGAEQPEWLPMAIASIAGFEMFMVIDAARRRRSGGGLNG